MAKRKKRTLRRILIDKLDDVCRDIIRIRDDWTCQRCDSYLKSKPKGAHPAHIFSKGAHPNLRHDLLNILLLCWVCHRWWHDESEGKVWFAKKFPVRDDYLWKKAYSILVSRKTSLADLEQLLVKHKQKLEEMLKGEQ